MDELLRKLNERRRDMIDAFAELTTLAHRAGVAPIEMTALHGMFFDGNVTVKYAAGGLALLARLERDE
jgi:hypothetical protein